MSWLKIDDGLFLHPKWVQTPPAARGLWITALSYCGRQMTDGFIPAQLLPLLGGTAGDAQDLVEAGLWEETAGGWNVHDFGAYNVTRDARQRLSDTRADAGRRSAQVRQQHASNTQQDVNNTSTNAQQNLTNAQQNAANFAPVPVPVPEYRIPVPEDISTAQGLYPGEGGPTDHPAREGAHVKGSGKGAAKPARPDPDAPGRALLAAFRAVRYPGRPVDSATDWTGYRDVLRSAAAAGVTTEQMRDATCAAIQRWQNRDMVNPRSVLRHLDALLEPEVPDRPQTRREIVQAQNDALLDSVFGPARDDSDEARARRARPIDGVTDEQMEKFWSYDTREERS